MLSLEKSKEYKQPDNTSAKGVGYPYYAHVGEVVEVDGKTDDLSIFKMNVALSYMEYGDQLVIVSFHKLREHGAKLNLSLTTTVGMMSTPRISFILIG